jgi:hypothetical protein
MTDRLPHTPKAPNPKKPWATPSLAQIATGDAEHSANPLPVDGISKGS